MRRRLTEIAAPTTHTLAEEENGLLIACVTVAESCSGGNKTKIMPP